MKRMQQSHLHNVSDVEQKWLPQLYHSHDTRWIVERMAELPRQYRHKAMIGYTEAYKEAYDSAPDIRKECAGRRAANTRLRLFVERVKRISDIHKPEVIG